MDYKNREIEEQLDEYDKKELLFGTTRLLQMMVNSDLSNRFVYLYLKTHDRFFFLHTFVCRDKKNVNFTFMIIHIL